VAVVIAVDFDGTIVDHAFPDIGVPVPGAFEWMKRWRELGADLVLWTVRSDGRADGTNPLNQAVAFCARNGVEFWGINRNPEQYRWSASPKAYAHLYVDDTALGCPLLPEPVRAGGRPVVDWATVGPAVEAFILKQRNGG